MLPSICGIFEPEFILCRGFSLVTVPFIRYWEGGINVEMLDEMKNRLYLLPIFLLLLSCQPEAETKEETLTGESTEKQEETITEEQATPENEEQVADKVAPYSKKFIDEIKNGNGVEDVEFVGGAMILNQRDSIPFPTIPVMNQKKTFTGKKDNLTIALTVERINYTSIEYALEMVDIGKSSKTVNGIADLNAYFFLGSESDLDEVSGEYFFSTQFSNAVDSCYTSIRIGNIEDSNAAPLLAKIIKNCNGEVMNIELDNFPTLREK